MAKLKKKEKQKRHYLNILRQFFSRKRKTSTQQDIPKQITPPSTEPITQPFKAFNFPSFPDDKIASFVILLPGENKMDEAEEQVEILRISWNTNFKLSEQN